MKRQIRNNQIFFPSFLSILVISASFSVMISSLSGTTSILAHNVKTNIDVGVTFHIEPDHSPQIGQESQAWFALTRKGGGLIPLAQCDCELNVYLDSDRNSQEKPLLTPTLISLSPEKYQNIPGANLVFPKPGIYQLELTGKPKETGDFTPFQVTYPVTVSSGFSTPRESKKISSESDQVAKQVSTKHPDQIAQSSSKKFSTKKEIKPNLPIIVPLLIGILVVSVGLITIWKLFVKSKDDNYPS